MEVEQLEIRDYLSQCAPLGSISEAHLNELTQTIEIEYKRRDCKVLEIGQTNQEIRLIRKGAVEIHKADGSLYGRYTEGEWVGYRSLMAQGQEVYLNVKTIEDTLFYIMPGEFFLDLMKQYDSVKHYFAERKERLQGAIRELSQDEYSLMSAQVSELMRPAFTVDQQLSIAETAHKMTQARRNTAMIVDEVGVLQGLVTDQDFRRRVIAEGVSTDAAIHTIMTVDPHTLSPQDNASEALLLMARRNIRHIPVIDRQKVLGVLSATDLLRQQSSNAVYLVGDIHLADNVDKLVELSNHLPQALQRMVRSGLPAYDIGHAISSIGQAIMRRLIMLAEQQFGEPPIPYAYIVAGSMARREQTAHSDQDAGMILSDAFVPALHDEYFLSIAQFVSDGMDACGYVYCPGDIMATNPQWRQPLKVWREYFRQWVDEPDPQALLYASIFFDLRSIYGANSLLDELQIEVLQRTKRQSLFQAFMAGNALQHQPPLGFFRGFILEKHGTDEAALNMKLRGVVPIIDIARVYALVYGLSELNTFERIQALGKVGGLGSESIEDLMEALEFIASVRLKHQAQQIQRGEKPDNFVSPDDLSPLERRHLKDSFEVVSQMQDMMTKQLRAGIN